MWLAPTELGADPGGELDAVEGQRDDIVGAEIEGTGAFERASRDDHEDFQSAQVRARFELGDQAAAGQVGGSRFGDQDLGSESEDLIDIEADFRGDVVALAGQGIVGLDEGFGAEIEKQDSH